MKLKRKVWMPLAAVVLARGSLAQTPPLVCYGNGPSWSLELSDTTARFQTSGKGEAISRAGRPRTPP